MVISRCTDCNHRDICKHKDEYDKVIRDITVKVPEPFTLTLSCRHYYSTTTYLTGSYDSATYSNCNNHSIAQLSSHYK
jgi:hypothetical protein